LSFNTISKEKRYAQRAVYSIAAYLLMKRFFGADEAEKAFAYENKFGNFGDYFILSKKAIECNKIGYAENFIPAFLSGVKKSESKSFKEKLRKFSLILACNGFPFLFRMLRKIREISEKYSKECLK